MSYKTQNTFMAAALSVLPVVTLAANQKPNIIFMVAEDMSWQDWGVYGNRFAKTPNIDKLAGEGVLFTHAFNNSPVCHPSRGTLLTGQDVWRLRDGAVFGGVLHNTFDTYPRMLRDGGYDAAHSGKGWGPGFIEPGGWTEPPTGRRAQLKQLINGGEKDRPFCFWWGSLQGHRPFGYRPDGRSLDSIEVPPYLPDTPSVREDFAGFYQEVEAFDREVGQVVDWLDSTGLSSNTLLVVTADHGRPWPRAKGSLYDLGMRVPLIVRWPARIKPGRRVDDIVNFIDLAPTFLEAAGLAASKQMTGKSMMNILVSEENGVIDLERDRTYFGLEAHPSGKAFRNWLGPMSCRAIRTRDYLYIRNYPRDGQTAYPPLQGGPGVGVMQQQMKTNETARANFNLCFGTRPEEELYDVKADPWQVHNLADAPQFSDVKEALRKDLADYMKTTGDPRVDGHGDVFGHYPVWTGGKAMAGVNRSGELESFDKSAYAQWMTENGYQMPAAEKKEEE
jgi:N-sulfoglucosamine sulfohydrolase